MYAPIETLPDSSRIWIYQLDRKLSAEEHGQLTQLLENFCSTWTAHDKNLRASFQLLFNCALVLTVDESMSAASGCSIDKSVHLLMRLQDELGIDFFNRMISVVVKEDEASPIDPENLKVGVSNGWISPDDLVLNALPKSLGDFRERQLLPIKESWQKRLIPA